ncbi:DNA-directed RNA polymerase subunit beta [Aneurinibacillus sp. REN35]|uniref:DNA-directed RNA polymerase subunit beta n=1 Tax=Aneurinibacillus sp. REN35 TaxID=3237286 RepID=UPI0035279962
MSEQSKTSQRATASGAVAQEGKEKNAAVKKRAKRRGGMPLLLKIMLVPFLLFIALLAGLIAGYSIVGNGSALDVFDMNTWKHMYNLVFG